MEHGTIRRAVTCAAAGCLIFQVAGVASAESLYDTFGPGDEYNTGGSWNNGNFFGYDTWNAMPFEIGSGEFENIEITMPLAWEDSSNATFFGFTVKVYADDGVNQDFDENPVNGGPGTELASLNQSAGFDLPQASGDGPWPVTTFEIEDLVLAGDARYWVAIETQTPADGVINWYLNTTGVQDNLAQRTSDSSGEFPDVWNISGVTNLEGAMRVTGNLVPAPGAAMLSALALAGLGARRRRSM